jgi:beta-glucanase (GH16 family)
VSKTSPTNYVGSVFGGGAYFEARIAFDPSKGALASEAWPAFWSMAVEHVYDSANATDVQWAGQEKGYAHFIELDFFEAVHMQLESYQGKTGYYGTIHDWSGAYGANGWAYNIQNNGNKLFKVGAVDWSAFHTYGCLWVPEAVDSPGSAQWFFDGIPGPIVYWRGPVTSPPLPGQGSSFTPSSPASAAATYAKIDSQRLAISLMTDPNWPMMVDWVKVWQEP